MEGSLEVARVKKSEGLSILKSKEANRQAEKDTSTTSISSRSNTQKERVKTSDFFKLNSQHKRQIEWEKWWR